MNTSEVLSKVIELSNAPIDIDRRLKNLVDTISITFSIPFSSLFLWDPQQASLSLKFSSKNQGAFPPGLRISLGEGPLGVCAQKKVPVIINDSSQQSLWDPPIPNFLSAFNFLAFFPIVDDIFLYGVLALLRELPRQLSEEETLILNLICRQLAGTIRTAQVSLQAKKRIAELSTLHAIGKAISSTTELGELLNRITLSSAKILQADGSTLCLLDEEERVLKVVSSFGLEADSASMKPTVMGENIFGKVAQTGEAILLKDIKGSSFAFSGFPREISSVVCVPLIFKSKTIGTLAIFCTHQNGRQEKIFDEEDKDLLSTMASQIAAAIENAIILRRAELLSKEKETMVLDLSTLYHLSQSMLTTIKLDQLLRIILISVTLGRRIGFNRAALFLVDEKENVLQGMMGIGPQNHAEADCWRQKIEGLQLFSPDWKVPEEIEKTPYDLRIQKVRISLDEKTSLLIKALREQRSFNVENAPSDPEVNPELLSWIGSQAFACIPLLAKGKAIGLIVVDNLLSAKPIKTEEIRFLTLLANQAALAIENARLYGNLQEINTQLLQTQNRLIQSEKMAALGEVIASITHEIKNPLVAIGGFARRLNRNLRETSPEKKYLRILLKEVMRLENILNETLVLSKENLIPHAPYDLHRILEDTLSILEGEFQERNISLTKELDPKLPPLLLDPPHIKQAFLNLFLNAIQAIGQNGNITLKTSIQHRDEHDLIQVEISDTGGGIPLKILDNIFNPFFTTKPEGTGLGLPIAHKIIIQHRGDIEVINHPGAGTTFMIHFPLSG